MSRNCGMTASTKRGGGGGGANGTGTTSQQQQQHRIKIRPYVKPPQLPANYYEEAAASILQGCLAVLRGRLKQQQPQQHLHQHQHHQHDQQQQQEPSSVGSSSSNPQPPQQHQTQNHQHQLSLQNAYTATVHLVSHQYGARLYADVVASMQEAAELVLPNDNDKNRNVSSSSLSAAQLHQQQALLAYAVQQYNAYAEYLLLLKHICLPLDRAWQWQWLLQSPPPDDASVAAGSGGSGGTTSNNTATTTIHGKAVAVHTFSAATGGGGSSGHPLHHHAISKSDGHNSSSAAAAAKSAATTATSPSQSAAHNHHHHQPLQTFWQVGLTVFLRRLQALQLDSVLYQQWLAALLQDWNGGGGGGDSNSNSNNNIGAAFAGMRNNSNNNRADDMSVRQCLQQVWYLWQDLGLIGQLPIQQDLEQSWSRESNEWKTAETARDDEMVSFSSSSSYKLTAFLQFAHSKLQHCHHWRPWLPTQWLWNILDVHLVQPHLNTEYLVSDAHLGPVLSDVVFAAQYNYQHHNHPPYHQQHHHYRNTNKDSPSDSTTANATSTTSMMSTNSTNNNLNPIQILWMLAGRLPGGQPLVSQSIQRFARQQGLLRMGVTTTQAPQQQQQVVAAAAAAAADMNNSATASTAATAVTSNKPQSKKVQQPNPAPTASTVVEDLLHLQDRLVSMIQQLPGAAAPNEPGTTNSGIISLKSVWEEVVNADTSPPLAEQLAKFLDVILRSNKKIDTYQTQSGSSSEFGWLQRIVAGLFVPLQAKDVFEAFYRRDLAKRLMWSRVVSMDAEKQVCSLLKAECGTGFTSKMEGMFQDVDWSRETMLVYKQSTAGMSANSSVEVEVQVLTTGYWPVYPVYPNLHLPDALKDPQDQFANHYKTKYQGRRMTWQYALGHCLVRANGFPKPYDLLVSLCQALVLIHFETSETILTLPQLLHATGLEDRGELERILQSLALGKDGSRILRKMDFDAEPGKKKKTRMNVDDRDIFVINSNFESNVRRVRITNVMIKETKEEREKTLETVNRDRLYLIDAVLVRIMKARKTIDHQALLLQVLEQMKVPVQQADVKIRIESLIEREYIERDAKDRKRYNYLA